MFDALLQEFNLTELPKGWKIEQLEDVCKGVFDCPHSTPKLSEKGPYLVRTQDIRCGFFDVDQAVSVSDETYAERIKRAEPSTGDLLFSREGTYFGDAAEVPLNTKVCLGQRMVLIRPNQTIVNSTYLRIWINSSFFQKFLLRFRDGTVAERLNLSVIRKLPVLIPDMAHQNFIKKNIVPFESKISVNRKTNQTLEQIAQTIFKSWFVDFEPVKAKAQVRASVAKGTTPGTTAGMQEVERSRTPEPSGQNSIHEKELEAMMELAAMCAISGKTEEQLKELNDEALQQLKTTAALFPDALVESDLGDIPKGWGITELGEILEFNPKRAIKKGTLAPYLDMKNVPTHGHLADDVYMREMASGTKFINGDTLLARITPCLENGKTAYVDFLENGQVAWGSTEYIVIRPKNDRPMSIGYIIARLDSFRSKAIQTMTGTSGRQRANAKALSEQLWIDYPITLLNKFDLIAGSYLKKAKINGDANKALSELRDTLLPKLLSGELLTNSNQTELKEAI